MKLLVSIPCLYGAEHTLEAITSVAYKENVDVLLIDNGAEPSVKEIIHSFELNLANVKVIHNPENRYVNPAWQQAIDYFLEHKEYSHLVLMNSDLIMHPLWNKVLFNRLAQNPDEITIPRLIDDKNFFGVNITSQPAEGQIVDCGTPGIFIVLNRKQVEIISPLPICCHVWFGDEYIYTILRKFGYVTIIPDNLYAYHYWSANVQKVANISQIIEEDKVQWTTVGKPTMLQVIEKHLKS